jgi:small redox-active disulfide protein 2
MPTRKVIEILGPGCPRCQETYRVVAQVVEQSGLDAEVRKDESIDRMVELGVLATPAVVVDGELKSAGQIPKPELVRKLLGIER